MEDRIVSLKAVENIVNKYIDGSFEWGAMLVQIKQLPSVSQPQGYWMDIYKGNTKTVIACRCSECEKSPKRNERSDFCPNCGADMRGNNDGR